MTSDVLNMSRPTEPLCGVIPRAGTLRRSQVPRLVVTQRLWQRLFHYVRGVGTEVSGFGTIATPGRELLLQDIFLLPEEVWADAAVIEAETIGRFLHEFVQAGGDPEQLRFQWHSHGNFGVSWSAQDERTIEELVGMSGSLISLVVNRQGDYLCRYDTVRPRRMRLDIPVFLRLEPVPEGLASQWTMELTQNVQTHEVREPVQPATMQGVQPGSTS